MPPDAELLSAKISDEALAFLRQCPDEERWSFAENLRAVRQAPIANSQRHVEPDLSKYELRRYQFGFGDSKIAIFDVDLAHRRIRVLRCRLFKKGRGGGA